MKQAYCKFHFSKTLVYRHMVALRMLWVSVLWMSCFVFFFRYPKGIHVETLETEKVTKNYTVH